MLKKDINNGFLRVSQLIESEQEAIAQLVAFDLLEFHKRAYKEEAHRLQFLTSRILIREIFEGLGVTYQGLTNERGLPDKVGDYTVSISHSDNLVAVGVSLNKLGLDIQKKDDKVNRVIARICNNDELCLADNSLKKTILWSVKESFYKRQRTNGVDFRNQLFVDSFKIIDTDIIGVGRVFVNKVTEIVRFEGSIINDYVFIYSI